MVQYVDKDKPNPKNVMPALNHTRNALVSPMFECGSERTSEAISRVESHIKDAINKIDDGGDELLPAAENVQMAREDLLKTIPKEHKSGKYKYPEYEWTNENILDFTATYISYLNQIENQIRRQHEINKKYER